MPHSAASWARAYREPGLVSRKLPVAMVDREYSPKLGESLGWVDHHPLHRVALPRLQSHRIQLAVNGVVNPQPGLDRVSRTVRIEPVDEPPRILGVDRHPQQPQHETCLTEQVFDVKRTTFVSDATGMGRGITASPAECAGMSLDARRGYAAKHSTCR